MYYEELSEGRFTAPTGICPNPERWNSTDEESTELEVSQLIMGLVFGLQPDLCVETGSAFGQTTKMIGEALKANCHGHLISYEIIQERANEVAKLCEGLPVDVIANRATENVIEICEPIQFAFFDSSHEDRIPEFEYFLPHLAPGAICAFHDTASGHSYNHALEKDLITRLRETPGVTVINLPTPRGLALVQVYP
jgi:predicted O-methyltransferase YrrM